MIGHEDHVRVDAQFFGIEATVVNVLNDASPGFDKS